MGRGGRVRLAMTYQSSHTSMDIPSQLGNSLTNVWLLWLPIVHMAIHQFIVLLCI
jgi:hypothetical protein